MGGTPISGVKVVDVYGVPTNATVPVTGNTFTIDGTSATYYYQITRNATPQPNIALSTNSLTPSCVQGSSPVDDSFQVWNTGNAPLNYTVSKDQSWLSVEPTSGTSSDQTDKKTDTVTYSTTGLRPATIAPTSRSAIRTPPTTRRSINVSLNVKTPSSIVSDTTVLNPVVTVGRNAISQQFKVWDGGRCRSTTLCPRTPDWLGANPANGTSTGVG